MLNLRILRIFAFTGLLFLTLSFAYAVDDDFDSARKIEGKYFTIYYSPQLDSSYLLQQLNIQPSDEIIVGKSAYRGNSSEAELAHMVDTLFMRVSDILDMHLYSFQAAIKICKDERQIERVYKSLFDQSLHHKKSFYVNDLNTIYISADSLKCEILGHEIAHAIISRYFVVPAPIKIQEILAMYTEYQLRKE